MVLVKEVSVVCTNFVKEDRGNWGFIVRGRNSYRPLLTFKIFRKIWKNYWRLLMIAIIFLQNISGFGFKISELGQERCFWCSKVKNEISTISRSDFWCRCWNLIKSLLKILFSRTHLMAFLVIILGSRSKKKYSELWNLESLGYLPYKFRLRRINTWVLLNKFHPRTHLMAFLVTILGSRNKKKYSEFWNWTF
jgi:hypothetical protein